jgi:hypothetical protein
MLQRLHYFVVDFLFYDEEVYDDDTVVDESIYAECG